MLWHWWRAAVTRANRKLRFQPRRLQPRMPNRMWCHRDRRRRMPWMTAFSAPCRARPEILRARHSRAAGSPIQKNDEQLNSAGCSRDRAPLFAASANVGYEEAAGVCFADVGYRPLTDSGRVKPDELPDCGHLLLRQLRENRDGRSVPKAARRAVRAPTAGICWSSRPK